MTQTIEPMPAQIDQQQLAQELVDKARAEGVDLVGPGGLPRCQWPGCGPRWWPSRSPHLSGLISAWWGGSLFGCGLRASGSSHRR